MRFPERKLSLDSYNTFLKGESLTAKELSVSCISLFARLQCIRMYGPSIVVEGTLERASCRVLARGAFFVHRQFTDRWLVYFVPTLTASKAVILSCVCVRSILRPPALHRPLARPLRTYSDSFQSCQRPKVAAPLR